jgi:hypothetical protein
LVALVAVPFVRTGSRFEELRTGIDAALSERSSIILSYDYQWADFDSDPLLHGGLPGGYSNGGNLAFRHRTSERLTMSVDYDIQQAVLRDQGIVSDIHNGSFGAEYKVSEPMRVSGAIGLSRFDAGVSTSTGVSWQLNLHRSLRRAGLDVTYSRAFVPSFGFVGTMQNQEVTGRLQVPFGRRLYSSAAGSWRHDIPLTPNEPLIQSAWFEGTIGYLATEWVHFELFYAGSHQEIGTVAAGMLDRNRVGFQIVTTKPMRLR